MRLAFGGMTKVDFSNLCDRFSQSKGIKIRQEALSQIEQHKKNNDTIYIVTASPYYWVEAWANQFEIPVIGTKLEEINGELTGNLLGNNCYGPEKVERVRASIDLSKYGHIVAYGDSRGDKELLGMADEKRFKPFR
jgi:HAD superfamily phosphoserine phosphatase-like hydrolase